MDVCIEGGLCCVCGHVVVCWCVYFVGVLYALICFAVCWCVVCCCVACLLCCVEVYCVLVCCVVCCVLLLSGIVLCCDGMFNFTNPSHSPVVARCIAEVHPSQSAMYASFSPHNAPIPKQSKALRMKSMVHNFNRGTTARRCTFLRQTSHPCHAFSALCDRLAALGAADYRLAELR